MKKESDVVSEPKQFRLRVFKGVGSFGPLGAKIRSYRGEWEKKGVKGNWEGGWEKAKEFEGKCSTLQ